jgi:hypothetical protein
MTRFARKAVKITDKHQPGGGAGPSGAPGPVPSAAPRWLPRWAVALLCVAVSAAATFALFEYVILSKIPRAMLGKWVVVEGPMEGATLEFFRDGTMIGRVDTPENKGVIEARVRSDGNTLWSTTKHPMTGQEETAEQTIVSLTETEIVLEDRKGARIKLQRAP